MTELVVNGRKVSTDAPKTVRLLDFLRDELGLTGTKEGCGKGECGACSVLLDGKVVDSCLVLLGQCEGASVLTIEGIGDESNPHPLQVAFAEAGAVQCGFCTPGLIVAGYALLSKDPRPSPSAVRRAIEGNLCRCTGYAKVEQAILEAAARMQEGSARR